MAGQGPPQQLEPEQMHAHRAGNPLAYLAIQETITLPVTMLCIYTGTNSLRSFNYVIRVFFSNFLHVFIYKGGGHTCVTVFMWRTEDSFQE